MPAFQVELVARNARDESRATPPVSALVDSGSELTWLPERLLRQAGTRSRKSLTFRTATGELATREVGFAVLAAEGFETADEVVFALDGDSTLLGVRDARRVRCSGRPRQPPLRQPRGARDRGTPRDCSCRTRRGIPRSLTFAIRGFVGRQLR